MSAFSFASHRSHHIYAFLSVLFVFLLKFPKNAKKQLTGPKSNAKMQSKLNRLIEARYPSVPSAKPVQLRNGKGATAEVPGNACCPVAGSAEKICRTVTRIFCEALSLAVRRRPIFKGQIFRIFHEPLGKAVHFFHHSQPAGKTIRRTRRRQS